MSSLLTVLASPRGEYSMSRALSATFVQQWTANHEGGSVVTRDLVSTKLPFVDPPWIAGAYTPTEQHSPEMKEALAISNELIAELRSADHLLIATPMYNFSTPAILKAWIDHVVRIGETFSSSYEGLLKNKKVTVIIASGSDYSPGAYMEGYNRETEYLKQILAFIGLTEVTFVMAGGTTGVAQGKMTQEEYLGQFTPVVAAAAAR